MRLGKRFRRRAGDIFLAKMTGTATREDELLLWGHRGCLGLILGRGLAERDLRLLRTPQVRRMLAADALVQRLAVKTEGWWLDTHLPIGLVEECGRMARSEPRALARLEHLARVRRGAAPMAASILHASGTGWRPDGRAIFPLSGAYLARARWPKLVLPGAILEEANLAGAVLVDSILDGATLSRASLSGADLSGASLRHVYAPEARLYGAHLSRVAAECAVLIRADLRKAVVESAELRAASLKGADLRGARLRQAVLRSARLQEAQLDGADFGDADLTDADLCGLDLTAANFSGARFVVADLRNCNLEGMNLAGCRFDRADLSGALMTASVLHGAGLRRAKLRGAGLGEVDWEGADLRGADLRGACFHMGSSRSGLLFGAPPGEGSRTGFYTDEYYDQIYRAPEEIRKANLRGADLRGARIDGVDFYLVDLRGARFTADQAAYFRRCGAILGV